MSKFKHVIEFLREKRDEYEQKFRNVEDKNPKMGLMHRMEEYNQAIQILERR